MRLCEYVGSEERSEEAEVIPGRDLSASMEKEWENSDQVTGGLEISVGNTETMEVMTDEKGNASIRIQNNVVCYSLVLHF